MVSTSPPSYTPTPWYQRLELPMVLPGAILSLLMLWSVVQSVANANWASGLQVLVSVALPGLIVGLVFARLYWLPAWLAHLLSGMLGIAWAVQQVGPLLVSEIAAELGSAQADRLATWGDRATEILIRFITLSRLLEAGGRGEDIVLFIVALALLMWALGYTTGWLLFRAEWAWAAVVLNALVILVNYTFASPKPNVLFFIFLGTALLLIVQRHVVRQQQLWQSSSMDYPEFISWRFLAAAALFCGAVVLVTSLLPSEVSSTQVARAWRVMSSPLTAAREGWEVAFSTINAPPGTNGGGFTTRAIRVGGGRALGDEVVMRVQSDNYDYWRAVVFDQYTGRGWLGTIGERARAATGVTTVEEARTAIEAGVSVPYSDVAGRELVTQTVTLEQDRSDSLLTIGGQLSTPNLPVLLQHGYVGLGAQAQANFDETATVVSVLPLQAGQTYTVTALVSTVDEQSLRNAGTAYPDWVRNHYLALPEGVTDRTREEARAIVEAAGADNPYDQALAIQNALRRFAYDEARPAPPDNQDWVDYFVFEGQRGYCDDFASAMAVMLRSLDIPTRWVQGYAGGSLDPTTNSYVVRESIAHSWPEVYFPGYGWQRFEPTPASYANPPIRPALPDENGEDQLGPTLPITPSQALDGPAFSDEEFVEPETTTSLIDQQAQAALRRQFLTAFAVLAAIGGLVGLAWLVLRREERGLSHAAAIYLRLTRLAGWAGLPQQPHVTPNEYGAELSRAIPNQRRTIQRVVGAYVAEQYTPQPLSDTSTLDEDWRTLRQPLLVRLLLRPWQALQERTGRRR